MRNCTCACANIYIYIFIYLYLSIYIYIYLYTRKGAHFRVIPHDPWVLLIRISSALSMSVYLYSQASAEPLGRGRRRTSR